MGEVYRQEKKYQLPLHHIYQLTGVLDQVMIQDPNNFSSSSEAWDSIHRLHKGGGYMVRSLYFDTAEDRDYEMKLDGAELRRKVRLRIYDPSHDFALLEVKQKQGVYQKKRSFRLSRRDAQEICKGRYDALLKYEDPFAAECYGLMHIHCYRPKIVVEYQRKAYLAKENNIRITFDHHISATESNLNLFEEDLATYPVLDWYNGVMEVKYNGFLLSYIKDLVSQAGRSELSVSKYCMAREAGTKCV